MAEKSNRREALVAGGFYEEEPDRLRAQLASCFQSALGPGRLPKVASAGEREVLGAVCPHAGVMYSGPAAALSYCRLAEDGVPEVAVIVAPAHFYPLRDLAVWTEGAWETPLGAVNVCAEVASALVQSHKEIKASHAPHLGMPPFRPEHSIEVQLPFLQFVYGERTPQIVPITVSTHDYDDLVGAGEALGHTLRGRNAVIIASCDLTHEEPHDRAKVQDLRALERIADLDAEGLFAVIARHHSLSDALVAIVMLTACQLLGATRGEVLGHITSGDATGDRSQVVGYGAATVLK